MKHRNGSVAYTQTHACARARRHCIENIAVLSQSLNRKLTYKNGLNNTSKLWNGKNLNFMRMCALYHNQNENSHIAVCRAQSLKIFFLLFSVLFVRLFLLFFFFVISVICSWFSSNVFVAFLILMKHIMQLYEIKLTIYYERHRMHHVIHVFLVCTHTILFCLFRYESGDSDACWKNDREVS